MSIFNLTGFDHGNTDRIDAAACGGLVGVSTLSTITDSYSTCSLNGDVNTGGIAGRNGTGSIIQNSYFSGIVVGSNAPGGISGLTPVEGAVTGSYWGMDTAWVEASGGGSGIGHEDISEEAEKAWSASIWDFPADEYPSLKWQQATSHNVIPPTGLAMAVGDDKYLLWWDEPSGDVIPDTYNIYLGEIGGRCYKMGTTVLSPTQSTAYVLMKKTINDEVADGVYAITVRAVSNSIESPNSSPLVFAIIEGGYIPITAPVALPAEDVLYNMFTATWDAYENADAYDIDVSVDENFASYVPGYVSLRTTLTSMDITGLLSETLYYYRVRSVVSLASSGNSLTVSCETPSYLPDIPELGAATAISNTGFDIAWTIGSDYEHFVFDLSEDAGFATYVPGYEHLETDALLLSITGLSQNTTYYYRIKSVYGSMESAYDDASVDTLDQMFIAIKTMSTPATQTFRIGNSVDSQISIVTGTIVSYQVYGGAVVAVNAKTCTIPSIADSAVNDADYVTITLAAYGAGETDTITIEDSSTMHHLYWLQGASGSLPFAWVGALPAGLTYLYLSGALIEWESPSDYSMPSGMKSIIMSGALLNLDLIDGYSMPSTLTYLYMSGALIKWSSPIDYELPSGMTFIFLAGAQMAWTSPEDYDMPASVTSILLSGNSIAWKCSGAMPTNLTYLALSGNSLAVTGLDVSGAQNLTTFNLSNFYGSTMTAANFSTLLQSLDTRTAAQLPATGTIGNTPDLKDTNQGGYWGDFSGVAAPSAVATALKSVCVTKAMALTINTWGCTVPGGSGDGVGFPANFGDWWRS